MSGATALVLAVLLLLGNAFFVGRRVRPDLGAAQPDRAAGAGRVADGPDHPVGDGEHLARHRGQPARHHGVQPAAGRDRRARPRPPDRARLSRRSAWGTPSCTRSPSPSRWPSSSTCTWCSARWCRRTSRWPARTGPRCCWPRWSGCSSRCCVRSSCCSTSSRGRSCASWASSCSRRWAPPTRARRSPRWSRSPAARGCWPTTEYGRLAGALGFAEKTVAAVLMAPGTLTTVPRGATAADVEDVCAATGYSRFPVTADDGSLMGYLHIKDVLETEPGRRTRVVDDKWIRPFAAVRPGRLPARRPGDPAAPGRAHGEGGGRRGRGRRPGHPRGRDRGARRRDPRRRPPRRAGLNARARIGSQHPPDRWIG